MSIETQAASSPAEVDVFGGQQPTFDEFSSYRQTGELPARFKPAEPAESATAAAPAASEGHEPGSEGASDTPAESQEPKPPTRKPNTAALRVSQINAAIEKLWQEDEPDLVRIGQLNATVDRIERQAGLKRQAEHAPASPAPASTEPAQPPQGTRPKPTVDAVDKDGKAKYATYEEYVEDLADWKAEGHLVRFQQAQQEQAQLQSLRVKLDESRTRYPDADAVIWPAAKAIHDAQIPPAIKEIFAGSDLFTDLCYKVGSDPDELTKFISLAQTSPRAALAKVFEYERGIREELSKPGKESTSGTAPEKKQTAAPKPPSPVSGGSSRAFDVSDESLSPEEWMRKRNKQLGK